MNDDIATTKEKASASSSTTPTNASPSRAGAKAHPLLATIEMELLADQGSDVPFALTSSMPGLIPQGSPTVISLIGIHQPVLVLLRLVGDIVERNGIRFVPDPDDAAWFAPGTGVPQGKGTAGGMFVPRALSPDGRELMFRATNPGDGGTYRARFNFEKTASATTALHGGPIIIND